jgi:hypothetical protein
MSPEEIDFAIELEWKRRRDVVRRVIQEHGSPKLLAEWERDMRDLDMGLTGARNCWHSLSEAQRRVLTILSAGRWLWRCRHSRKRYEAMGEPHATGPVARLDTVYALVRHGLLQWDGPETDFNAKAVLTERARFVLQHGRSTERNPESPLTPPPQASGERA